MKVLLIRPASVYPESQTKGNFGVPPIGIAYLAAYLNKHGVPTTCLDAYGEGLDCIERMENGSLLVHGLSTEEILKRIDPDVNVIGISCMFSNEWIYSRHLLKKIREAFPHVLMILGGEHPTADPQVCFDDVPDLDLIVKGEGEETLLEVVRAFEQQQSYSHLPNVIFKNGNSITTNPSRARIKNLDELPWPDWSTVPITKYMDRKLGYGRYGVRSMPLLASRGCPYKCTFCSNPLMWGNKWYVRNVDDVIKEISHYHRIYQAQHFDFLDLTTIIRENWIIEFSEKLAALNLGVTWALPTGTRSEALTANALQALKKSGCIKLNYAPESGSKNSLKRIKKQVDLKNMTVSMRTSVRMGIVTRANIIIGLPDDDWKDLFSTFRFILNLAFIGLHDVACFSFSPYPGSELHNRLISEGRIKKSSPEFTHTIAFNITNAGGTAHSWNPRFSSSAIQTIIVVFHAMFYGLQFLLRPFRIFTTFYRILTQRSLTTLEIVASNRLRTFLSK